MFIKYAKKVAAIPNKIFSQTHSLSSSLEEPKGGRVWKRFLWKLNFPWLTIEQIQLFTAARVLPPNDHHSKCSKSVRTVDKSEWNISVSPWIKHVSKPHNVSTFERAFQGGKTYSTMTASQIWKQNFMSLVVDAFHRWRNRKKTVWLCGFNKCFNVFRSK